MQFLLMGIGLFKFLLVVVHTPTSRKGISISLTKTQGSLEFFCAVLGRFIFARTRTEVLAQKQLLSVEVARAP
jgi:hypothetical protein